MELHQRADQIRRDIIKISYKTGAGHLTSSLSCVEILTALYFGGVMRYDSNNPNMPERDKFILSKAHAAMGVYAVLARAGFFPYDELFTMCEKGSRLGGHPALDVPGIEHHTGALGHGLSVSVGFALAAKVKNSDSRIFCLTGDGELQEGSNWEAALSVAHFKLTNIIWIIDYNHLQLGGTVEHIMDIALLREKITAFGFTVSEADGHNVYALADLMNNKTSDRPIAIIANTIKGKGIPLIENSPNWHGRKPGKQEWEAILHQIKLTHDDIAGA
jgi:transketolase